MEKKIVGRKLKRVRKTDIVLSNGRASRKDK